MSATTADFKGILGTKLGMTQVFDENARVVPVTVIQAGPCTGTQVKSVERDGYPAVQLAYGDIAPRKVTKPRAGHFAKAGSEPKRHLVELRTASAGEYAPGQELKADVFASGDRVDVVGVSKGKGTAGVMKRHGFSGLPASHGTERKHRSPGSVGACATRASPCSTSRSSRSTRTATCCSSGAPCPVPSAACSCSAHPYGRPSCRQGGR